ncbi:hypothetical protein HHK36_004720 [Tetracentron sinense]|uniref:Uncharacterized protein n=1 Tax=Tetracentron sinense TaxID=13715 RepID=A0A834ZLR5_TETSI|nr:hypothetical protein HHK36_004720 [Tetracentron sinense]
MLTFFTFYWSQSFHLKTPAGGCLAVVLRTGFEISQGKLMRTLLFSTERVTANSWESGIFILFLVIFAVIAAGYVLKKGLEDPTRSKYKLFLSFSLIITSVIPPELPLELSIAVNTSLIALAKRGIFCTEPFRIPFAGKVDICCFDKTGTLTSDDMEFCGVVGLTDSVDLESDMTKVPLRTVEILAACHALVFVDNKLVGDPLEKATLKGIQWNYKSDEKAMPTKGGGNAVQIIQRHHFASHLKRMVVVVRVQEEFLAFVKQAQDPDRQEPDRMKMYHMMHVRRDGTFFDQASADLYVSEARSLDRDLVESGLTFAGFAVFNCPIRADSASVLSELKGSSHDLVFARVAPEQKELIMTTFKTVGRMALMCGDETNDVGALKQAHVGVALLNSVPPAQPGDSSPQTSKAKPKKPKAGLESPSSGKTPVLNGDGSTRSRAVARSDPSGPSGGNRNLTPAEMQRERLKRLMDDMNEEGDGRGPPIVKLGDASMASPFTAKHASVAPTKDIIRLQMFKILDLNCLATAYVLSVMNLDGVKLGDVQATISGIFAAAFAFFLFISHARPIQTLSAARPHPNIFSAYMFLSLLRQFAIHLLFLISSVNEAGKYMPDECIEPDSDFHPTW